MNAASRTICACLVLGSEVAVSKNVDTDPEFPKFQAFIEKFRAGTGYSSEIEMVGRFEAFKNNLRLAEERTARGLQNAKLGRKPETHGVTQFMDLTPEEFTAKHKGYRPMKGKTPLPPKKAFSNLNATAQSIDWNAKGALTPIKNQGQCGSCWAFSATEQLESQYFQKFGVLKELAPQQIVSCDTTDAGCNGGNPINAWGYVSGFGGQELSSDYPYTSGTTEQSGTCKSDSGDVSEDVGSSYTMIADTPSEESNMLAQIQESPMSVCVDATLWQTYTGGVITASSGCGTSIDHAVQATGYNAAGNYWIVRNSWADTWGEDGFVWVEYGSNVCGITDQATIVSVEKITEKSFKPATCTGSGDPTVAATVCYSGSAGIGPLKETVKVDLKKYEAGTGTLALTGTGIQGITCGDHSFSKSGQEVTVDLTDCLPDAVTVTDIKYCSDTDQIAVTVKDKTVPLPITATLSKVACGAIVV